MCFAIHPEYQEKLIAKKDIVCYKVLDKIESRYFGPYQGTEYRFGRVRKSVIGEVDEWKTHKQVGKGLHSYMTLKKAKYRHNDISYVCDGIAVLFECVIPKGSEYYKNPDGAKMEYISNQLIIVKRLSRYE